MVIHVYVPISNAEEAEVEWFYEYLQDLLELTSKKDVLFIIGNWNAKVGMHWRRKWQPTPMFLPGESQGRGSLVGCHLLGHTESDTTEAT